jgi:hypothetical protein
MPTKTKPTVTKPVRGLTKPPKVAAAPASNAGALAAIASASTSLAAITTLLDALPLEHLTTQGRRDSNGKLRDGEPGAMLNVLTVVDAFIASFGSLADKDGGVDDSVVETAPARADIAMYQALAPLVAQVATLHEALSDTMLTLASSAKEVTGPAYAIIRANAPANPKMAALAAPATKFYGHAAKQRAANKAKLARQAKKAAK